MEKINEEFICEHCGTFNPKAEQTCRNHCKNCLYSKHLDEETPGDRLSKCHGLMTPLRIDYSASKGFKIIHGCIKCLKRIANKSLPDDNIDEITKIMQRQNLDG